MVLEPARGDLSTAGIQQSLTQNLRFGGSGDNQMYLIGSEDLLETEGDGLLRHLIGISPESAGILNPCGLLQGHNATATACQ